MAWKRLQDLEARDRRFRGKPPVRSFRQQEKGASEKLIVLEVFREGKRIHDFLWLDS